MTFQDKDEHWQDDIPRTRNRLWQLVLAVPLLWWGALALVGAGNVLAVSVAMLAPEPVKPKCRAEPPPPDHPPGGNQPTCGEGPQQGEDVPPPGPLMPPPPLAGGKAVVIVLATTEINPPPEALTAVLTRVEKSFGQHLAGNAVHVAIVKHEAGHAVEHAVEFVRWDEWQTNAHNTNAVLFAGGLSAIVEEVRCRQRGNSQERDERPLFIVWHTDEDLDGDFHVDQLRDELSDGVFLYWSGRYAANSRTGKLVAWLRHGNRVATVSPDGTSWGSLLNHIQQWLQDPSPPTND